MIKIYFKKNIFKYLGGRKINKMKTKSKLTYLINIIICMLIITGIYLGGIFILDYLNSQGFIKNHFSTFYQDAIRQSISVFGTFLTIGTTCSIYHMDSKKYKDKEIELRYIESRPFFHLKNVEGKKVISFKSLKQEGIVLINVKVFYFGFNARLLHIDELHDMSCGENDTGIDNYIVLDQEKYFLSQFIAVKATTIYNESVYFVNDCFEQRGYNFIKEINKNKSTLVQFKNINGDIIGEEKFNKKISSIIKYLDDNYDVSVYRDQTLVNDIKQAMVKLQERNINDLSLVITLIRNYRNDIKYDEVIRLLQSAKNILSNTDETAGNEVPAEEYGYFIGNLICTENFRNKYSKIFENAMSNKVDSKQIMIDYLNDYINEFINAKLRGEEINKDYPLRNLEVYLSHYVESVTKIDNTEIMGHMASLLDRVEKEK